MEEGVPQLPDHALAVRSPGDVEPGYRWATLRDDLTVFLEEGETVLGHFTGRLEVRADELSDTELIVTDRRAVWRNPKFAKGSTWLGIGGLGSAVALTAMAVSAARASHRRHGRAALGQVRYEWLSAVRIRRKKSLIGIVDSYVILDFKGAGSSLRCEWWFRQKGVADEVAELIARAATDLWLGGCGSNLTDDEAEGLEALKAGGELTGALGERAWRFPAGSAFDRLTVDRAAAWNPR